MNPDDVVFTEEEKEPTPPSIWEMAQAGKAGHKFHIFYCGGDSDTYAITSQITAVTDKDGDVWFARREWPNCWQRKSAVEAILIQKVTE